MGFTNLTMETENTSSPEQGSAQTAAEAYLAVTGTAPVDQEDDPIPTLEEPEAEPAEEPDAESGDDEGTSDPWDDEDDDDESEPLAILDKLPEEVRGQVRELAEKAAKADVAISWVDALQNPATAREAYQQLGKQLGVVQEDEDALDYDREKFASPVEAQLTKELAELRQSIQQDREARELERFTASQAPKVEKTLSVQYPGFKVTPKMLQKAITTYPMHRDDPARAIKAFYTDQLADHRAKAVLPRKAPTMAKPGRAEGTRVDMANITAEQAYRLALSESPD